jgi:hypothetical protein
MEYIKSLKNLLAMDLYLALIILVLNIIKYSKEKIVIYNSCCGYLKT